MSYYDAVVMVVSFCGLIMLFQTYRNPILDKRTRRSFCGSFAMLVVIVFAEWANIKMNGMPESVLDLHYLVKGVEFIATPMLPLCLYDTTPKQVIPRFPFFVMAGINAVLVFLSKALGFLYYMDENNVYHRGNHHVVFVVIYVSAMLYMAIGISLSLKEYQANCLPVIMLTGVFAFTGIAIQLFSNDVRTSWLTIMMVVIIYYNELIQITLKSDSLTSVLNRHCYEHDLELTGSRFMVTMFDIDEFKSINDNFGHEAGDDCLKRAAKCIKKVYGWDAVIYRIGGDEFCAIYKRRSISDNEAVALTFARALADRLAKTVDLEENNSYHLKGISVGSAYMHEGESAADVIRRADKAMYDMKYAKKGVKVIMPMAAGPYDT